MKILEEFKKNRSFGESERDEIAEIVRRAREASESGESSRLSSRARARILQEALESGAAPRFWPALFAPTGRLIVAGSLPLVLAGALMFLMNRSAVEAPAAVATAGGTAAVQVAKVEGRLHFTIANGSREHVVYRSTAPDRFERSKGVPVTDGSYDEALDDAAALVFYRID
jgi:hypothetical protein